MVSSKQHSGLPAKIACADCGFRPHQVNMGELSARVALAVEAAIWIGVQRIDSESARAKDAEQFRIAVRPDFYSTPWDMRFIQFCIKQIERRFKTKTTLPYLDTASAVWAMAPDSQRLLSAEMGAIAFWKTADDQMHCGVVFALLSPSEMMVIEGAICSSGVFDRGDDSVSAHKRFSTFCGEPPLVGFLRVF